MVSKLEIVLWVISIFIPLAVVTTGLLLLRRKAPPRPCTDASACNLKSQTIQPVLQDTVACGAQPVRCALTDPGACDTCGEGWACTAVRANDTDYGVDGSFCLPAKPSNACTQVPADPNERMQGVWRWTGWTGVNTQAWSCACPYPSFYPMDTTANSTSAGACKRSSALCRGGTWTYPCKRPVVCDNDTCTTDTTTCEVLTPDERESLLGADVWEFGQCECRPGDRVHMDVSTGLPVCVPDTCAALPTCNADTPCPGNAACVNNTCVRASSTCATNSDCGKGGVCESDGTCTWGHWKTLPISPYVFGSCDCPDACTSVGSLCAC